MTEWQIRAPIGRVWDAIYDSDGWPEWWPGVEKVVQLKPAGDNGLGGLTRTVWKSALPYRLTIESTAVRVDRPHAIDGRSAGELEGEGHWRLAEQAGVTTVRYEWNVATTRPWMNLLGPLAKPLFAWNHDVVMRRGGEGIRRLLEAPGSAAPGFNPDRLAYLETEIWRAYYDRRWSRVLLLVLWLTREQFHLSWPRAMLAAYYSIRAAIAWAPDNHDVTLVGAYLRKFYRAAHVRSAESGNQELRYWDLHRALSGRPESEKGPLEQSLAELHASLFGISVEAAYESAVLRTRAANAVDLITSGQSQDWSTVERYLREAYRSVAAQLAKPKLDLKDFDACV